MFCSVTIRPVLFIAYTRAGSIPEAPAACTRALQVSSCDSTLRNSGADETGSKKSGSSGPGSLPNFSRNNRFCCVMGFCGCTINGNRLLGVRFCCALATGLPLSRSSRHDQQPPMILPEPRPSPVESVSGSSSCRTGVFPHYGYATVLLPLPGISNDLVVVRLL